MVNQKKAATVFTLIIFILAAGFLYMHFQKPPVSETIITDNYFIESITTPQKKVVSDKYAIKVLATQGNELIVEVNNKTAKESTIGDYCWLYKAYVDNSRVKVDDKAYKLDVTRGHSRYEIVKKVPAQTTKEVVFDMSSIGGAAPGSYVIVICGQYLYFTLSPNTAA